MKKALLIIAAVAAYALFEAGLLLSTLQPNFLSDGFFSKFDAAVFFGQIMLIPAFAALFSRLMYGPQRWSWRALKIVVVPIGIFASILVFAGFALLLDWIISNFNLDANPWISTSLAILFLVGILAAIVLTLFIGFSSSGVKSIALESTRWLSERRSGVSARERKWRNRGIRWALCVPALIVLLIFFFLPESEHVLSTLRHPRAIRVGGYKVRVPANWLVLADWTNDGGRGSGLYGLTGLELGSEFGAFIHGALTLSEWRIEAPSSLNPQSQRSWEGETSVGKRTISLVNGTITCLEYNRPYHRHLSVIAVRCSGPGGLQASLFGEQRHIPEFYHALEQITVAEK